MIIIIWVFIFIFNHSFFVIFSPCLDQLAWLAFFAVILVKLFNISSTAKLYYMYQSSCKLQAFCCWFFKLQFQKYSSYFINKQNITFYYCQAKTWKKHTKSDHWDFIGLGLKHFHQMNEKQMLSIGLLLLHGTWGQFGFVPGSSLYGASFIQDWLTDILLIVLCTCRMCRMTFWNIEI